MRTITRYWRSHGTKILGFLTTVVAGLPMIEGLIDAADKPYWSAANLILGALTIQRGVTNSRNQQ